MKLSKRDSILLVSIGLLALVGGIYWFYVKPAQARLDKKSAEATEVQNKVDDLRSRVSSLASVTTGPTTRTPAELRLAKALPPVQDTPANILELERLAERSNVDLSSLHPGQAQDAGGITGTSFTLQASGRFLALYDFLYSLDRQVTAAPSGKVWVKGRLFAVTKVDLKPGDQSTTGAAPTGIPTSGQLSADVAIVAFSQTPAGGSSSTGRGSAATPVAQAQGAAATQSSPTSAPAGGAAK